MIYIVQSAADAESPVKIGWSTRLDTRLRTLQNANSSEIRVLRTIDGDRWVEVWLHQRFAANRMDGEWFAFSEEMLTVSPPDERPDKPKDTGVSTLCIRMLRRDILKLERAAKADHRPPSTLARKILRDFLRKQGLLKEPAR